MEMIILGRQLANIAASLKNMKISWPAWRSVAQEK